MPFLSIFYLKERILLLQSAIHEHCTESIFIENIKSWWERQGLGAEALPKLRAQGDEWAVRQDRKSRNLADTGIKRACVAVHRTHIRQNCLKKLCPWAFCPFFLYFSLPLHTAVYLFLTLSSLSFSAPNVTSAFSLFSLFFPSPPCSSALQCLCVCVMHVASHLAIFLWDKSEHANESIWASGACASVCVCVFNFALEAYTYTDRPLRFLNLTRTCSTAH